MEREKAGLELRVGTYEAQAAAYCATIDHLKSELAQHRPSGNQVTYRCTLLKWIMTLLQINRNYILIAHDFFHKRCLIVFIYAPAVAWHLIL